MEKIEFKKIIRSKSFWIQFIKFFSTILAGITVVVGYAEVYLEGQIDERIEFNKSQEEVNNKPFRVLLSESLDVPVEIVPYYLTEKINALDSLLVDVENFSNEILPFVQHQMTWVFPHMEIDPEDGTVYWYHFDGRPHEVDYKFGFGRIWYNHEWVPIYN